MIIMMKHKHKYVTLEKNVRVDGATVVAIMLLLIECFSIILKWHSIRKVFYQEN